MIEQGAMHPDIEQVLFTEEDIAAMVKRMGAEISRDYQGKDLVLIAVLRGAVVFMGDLMRSIDVPLAIDFMAVSSYGDKAKSSGVVRIVKDLDMDIKGRDVLIVEDILDSGLTLKYLMKNLSSRNPRVHRGGNLPVEGRGGQAGCNQPQVRGHPLPGCVRGGVRPRFCRALSQPPLCGDSQAGGLFVI